MVRYEAGKAIRFASKAEEAAKAGRIGLAISFFDIAQVAKKCALADVDGAGFDDTCLVEVACQRVRQAYKVILDCKARR